MHPAVFLGDVGREGLYVGGQELFHGADLQNLVHDGMAVCYGHQRGLVRGVLSLAALFGPGVQLQLVKQEFSHLFGGGDVQRGFTGHLADAGLSLGQLPAKPFGKFLQAGQVYFYAVSFHLGQDFGQGLFHGVIKVRKVLTELVSQGNEHRRFLQVRGVLFLGNGVKKGTCRGRGR